MKIITGVELAHDSAYLGKRFDSMEGNIDDIIGLKPNYS